MPRQLSILVVAGHPADSIDRAGGTMAIHADRGDRVAAVILTAGAHTHPVDLQDKLKRGERMDESEEERQMRSVADEKCAAVRAGLSLLGVDEVYFVGEDDRALLPSEDIVRKMARIVRRVKPDIVITHHLSSPAEHAVASICTLRAIAEAVRPDPDGSEPPMPMPMQILYHYKLPFYSWVTNCDYWWDLAVDISQVVDRKVAALEKIVTQHWGNFAAKQQEGIFGGTGVLSGTGHAELFIRNVPEVHTHLPVSDYQRGLMRQSSAEMWDRMSKVIEPKTGR